ncbi:SagB/ThcOx family dehydrogenase [Qaidamihabitans albus]|uniref:SagB/ThcOx family dehydrogenase n=1 Tax=Qaidamihabitans albus TaxID=2795733 RepID=UPI0018F1D96E|nr:SagB/ThcOx family dehydrogenase [Qaidamihabitans albus]
MSPAPSGPFEDFWAAGRTTPLTLRRLAARLAGYRAEGTGPDPFELPGGYHTLARPNDRLSRLFRRRRSDRGFTSAPLPGRRLGSVLAPLAEGETGRGYPSAGGLYPLRCYPLLLNVRHELSGRVCRYEPARHALQDVGACPPWPELAPLLGAEPADGPGPQFVLVLVLADAPLLAKYGVRGGRYGLIEAGCAAQSVALRAAADGLGGYLLGAAADDAVLGLLDLAERDVRLAAAFAGGSPSP